MAENLIIQKAVPDDAGNILKIQKSAFYAQALLYSDFSLPPLTETRDAILAAFRDHTILKAVQNGAIIGAVRGKADNGTCHVSRLVVEPELQDNGIGSRLMTALKTVSPTWTVSNYLPVPKVPKASICITNWAIINAGKCGKTTISC